MLFRSTEDVIQSILHGSAGITIKVRPNAGYSFTYSFDGQSTEISFDEESKTITISNITAAREIVFKATANENVLRISAENASVEKDGNVVETEVVDGKLYYLIKANTGTTATFTIKPNAGYRLTADIASAIASDTIGAVLKGDNIEVTWQNFTSDARLALSAEAKDNQFSFSGIHVDRVIVNEKTLDNVSASQTVATGATATVIVYLKYGYKNITLGSFAQGVTTVEGEETFANGVFYKQFEIKGFTDDVLISVSANKRTYNFEIIAGDNGTLVDGNGETKSLNVSVEYEASFTLTAKADDSYAFSSWTNGNTVVSYENPFTFKTKDNDKELNNRIIAILENVDENGNIVINANFIEAAKEFGILLSGKGSASYILDGELFEISSGNEAKATAKFGQPFILDLKPIAGYEVKNENIKFFRDNAAISFEDFTLIDNALTINLKEGNVFDRIEISFTAAKATVSVQAVLEMLQSRDYGNGAGGSVYIAKADGTIDENAIYTGNAGIKGVDYTVDSVTDGVLYFIAEIEDGYSFVASASEGITVNSTKLNVASGEKARVFITVSSIKDGANIYGIFVAQAHQVSIKFQDKEGNDLPAGYIYIEPSNNMLVSVDNNNSSNVFVSVMADKTQEVKITVRTNFNFSFVQDNGKMAKKFTFSGSELKPSDFTTAFEDGSIQTIDIENNPKAGYREQAVMTFTGLIRHAEIVIVVEPKNYQIVFRDGVNEELGRIDATYGRELSIPDAVRQKILDKIANNSDSSFDGFYTYGLGQGRKYIEMQDGQLRVLRNWLESGYVWNGDTYEKSTNFEPSTNPAYDGIFELYASWLFNKEKLTIDFIPDILKDKAEKSNISVTDIIDRLSADTYWTNVNEAFYAEIKEGTSIWLKPYNFEGYTFKGWLIGDKFEGGDANGIYKHTCGKDELTIKAVYYANFEITVNGEGGKAFVKQDESELGSKGSVDTDKNFSLVAIANKGYKLIGWFNTETQEYLTEDGVRLLGAYYNDGTEERWTLAQPATVNPFAYMAVFEGNSIKVILDMSLVNINNQAKIEIADAILVNGEQVANKNNFEARIGDEITLQAKSAYGYGIVWQGIKFEAVSAGENGFTVYKYVVKYDDLSTNGSLVRDTIIIRPEPNATSINFRFNVSVEGNSHSAEKAGVLTDMSTGAEISTGTFVEGIRFGQVIRIRVSLASNYDIKSVAIVSKGQLILDFATMNSGYNKEQNEIRINTNILENERLMPAEGESVYIFIDYSRTLWQNVRSSSLEGDGSENNPYIISSENDLALMAYMINSGDETYANAHYKLAKNLNLSGRFWEPIGTATNPFNGVFDMGPYSIANAEHYETYTNPTTSYNGVFRYMGSDAKVLTSSNTLALALGISGGILLLIILIILIIVLSRRAHKKKIDELANS